MTLKEAIGIRISRRKYTPTPIDQTSVSILQALIEKYNEEANLDIRLVLNNGDAFNNFRKTYGLFSNVQNYITLILDSQNANGLEKLGYYGELLVLNATILGLGTCWVGGAFDREACPFKLERGKTIACTIVIGNIDIPKTGEKLFRSASHLKTKPLEKQFTSEGKIPEWFMSGMKAVEKAPAAMNWRPVIFSNKDGVVTASLPNRSEDKTSAGMEVDLGIAKLHFELGAGNGKWQWGNGSLFKHGEANV
jgi:hypothetical protein